MPFKTFAFSRCGPNGDETFYMPGGMVMVVPNERRQKREGRKERKMEERKIFSDLKREVIDAGNCTLCGGCVATCRLLDLGFLSMDFSEGKPVLGEGQKCPIDCGYCYYQCPRVAEPESREGLEEFYEVVNIDEEIQQACPDDGVVTSLLASALADALVEGIVTVAHNEGSTPEVRIAMNKAGLIENAGGNYASVPALTGIADAILNYGLWSVALVGTPCQMAAYEKMLTVGRGTHNAHNFSSVVRLRIGLFCNGAYSDEATKREGCEICEDLIGQFADLSVGSIGAVEGVSIVIVHTDFGKEVVESARQWGFINAKPLGQADTDWIRRVQQEKKDAGRAEKERRAN
jgi:coenzyme F420 hydrogenase subunit beta